MAVTCATLVVVQGTASTGASAAEVDTPGAADSAGLDCSETADLTRHLVLFDEGTPTERAEREIARACGETTTYYPQLGVGVATTAEPDFASRIGPGRTFSAQEQRSGVAQAASSSQAPGSELPELASTDPEVVPETDRSDEQWNMHLINAYRAQEISTSDQEVVVGVLDSGIDAEHPELSDSIDPALSTSCLSGEPNTGEGVGELGEPRRTSPHGTHVAGTIAAADDDSGTVGVAPDATLASIKVIGQRGYADPEAVVCGLVWAAENEIAITNSSYVVDSPSFSCSSDDGFAVAREAMARAADYAATSGTLNIAAATNEGVDLSQAAARGTTDTGDGCLAFPASLRSVLAVSAINRDETKAGYSSYGLGVIDLAAPGGESPECILSPVRDGFSRICGASMAAPHVAGAAALVASSNPGYTPEQITEALTTHARSLACPSDYDLNDDGRQNGYCRGYTGYNSFYGHGLVDVHATLRATGTPDSR